MMKEIKFRAWDKTQPPGMSSWDDLKKQPLHILENQEHRVLMQYTGLKDATGEEYCHHDIFECDGFWYEVLWSDDYGEWLAYDIYNNETMSLGEFHKVSDAFIQGNRFENPELLEKKL